MVAAKEEGMSLHVYIRHLRKKFPTTRGGSDVAFVLSIKRIEKRY
jgi:hypothetical protein